MWDLSECACVCVCVRVCVRERQSVYLCIYVSRLMRTRDENEGV